MLIFDVKKVKFYKQVFFFFEIFVLDGTQEQTSRREVRFVMGFY